MDYVQGTWKVPTRKLFFITPRDNFLYFVPIHIKWTQECNFYRFGWLCHSWLNRLESQAEGWEARQGRNPLSVHFTAASLQQSQPSQGSDLMMTCNCTLCPAMLSFRHLLPWLCRGHNTILSEILQSHQKTEPNFKPMFTWSSDLGHSSLELDLFIHIPKSLSPFFPRIDRSKSGYVSF